MFAVGAADCSGHPRIINAPRRFHISQRDPFWRRLRLLVFEGLFLVQVVTGGFSPSENGEQDERAVSTRSHLAKLQHQPGIGISRDRVPKSMGELAGTEPSQG